MKGVILIGGGGHALSLLEIIKDKNIIVGYSDMKPNALLPIPYLGTDEDILKNYSPELYEVHHVIVYTSEVNLQLRSRMLDLFKMYKQHTFVADSAIITSSVVLGEGSALLNRTVVNRAIIGKSCIINTGAIVEHDVILGNNVFVGPASVIGGESTIGNNVFIGAGALIRDGVTIGDDVVIGMGAVVVKDIIKGGVYIGNPAKIINL